MQRREVLTRLAALGGIALLQPPAFAQSGERYSTLATPQPTPADGRVEVLEFFSYGCPHCNTFEPDLARWAKALPAHVSFARVPVTFGRQQWAEFARIYYTLEALGELERMHSQVFAAIHGDRVALHKEDVRTQWLAAKGLDSKKFADAAKSFGVQSRLQRGEQLAAGYKVDGVPLMAVAGKYLVSASQAGTYAGLLQTVDELVAKERAARGKS